MNYFSIALETIREPETTYPKYAHEYIKTAPSAIHNNIYGDRNRDNQEGSKWPLQQVTY